MKTTILPKLTPFSRVSAITLAALAFLPSQSLHATDYFWSGATGTYNNPAAWGGIVPGVADKAINDNGAGNAVEINIGDPDWIVNGIMAGRSTGNGAFVQNGQALYLTNATGRGAVRLGVAPGLSGSYTINGGNLNYTGEFNVGELGSASLTVNGGTISGSGNLAITIGNSLESVSATMAGTNKGDFTWFEQGFHQADVTRGIPPAGSQLVSESLPDHVFTMPATYAAPNAVQVFNGINNASINFNSPTVASTLSFLGSAGMGDTTVNYTIHFSDTTTEAGTINIRDWFTNDGTVAHRAGGRITANGLNLAIINDGPNKPYLLTFDVAVVNATKPITKVDLSYVSGGVASVLAVSASTGGGFTPVAFTGYNQDIVVENGAQIYIASNVTNVLNQVAGSINVTGEVFIGNRGAGVYNLSGGTNNFANWFVLGRSGGHGRMTMTGGQIDKTGGGNFVLGTAHQNYSGGTPSGVLTQSGGVINSSGEFMIPENSPASGEYHLSGTGVLNVNNWMQVGRSGGTGFMTMSGGTVNKTGGGNFIVGDNATGTLNQSGGTITVNNEGWVGQGGSGNGTYNLSGGSISVGNWIAIGRGGGVGVVNLTNGTINKVNNGNLAIGSGGGTLGTLNQYGGAVSNTVNAGSITYLGEASGNGTWNLHGGTAYLGLLQFCQGGNGSGTLYLNGGLLNVREINCGVAGANGAFFFNGGTLQANADNLNFFSGLGSTFVDAGGAVIDSQGYNVTMAQTISDFGGGGLTKLGMGTLTLTGFNNYSGATLVNAGTLAVTTDSAASGTGGYTVATGAKLAVKVQYDEAQLHTASATFAASATTLEVDLGNFGNPTMAPINLFGDLAVNGTVTIDLKDSLPQLGQFPLIKYGTKSGAGSFVIGNLPVGVVASVVDNVANSSIDINITTVNAPRWDGQAGGNWDIGVTANWVNIGDGLPTFFAQGNPVIFNDLAAGTTTANLVATVNPTSVTFDNSGLSYTLTGSGKISGSTGLTKQGSGVTTIANTGGNDFTGKTVIAGGTLSVASLANGGSPSAIGASSASAANLEIAGGTLDYTGPSTAINRGYTVGGTNSSINLINNLTVSGSIAAAQNANFVKTGLGQVAYTGAGSNVLSGPGSSGYWVQDGAVSLEGVSGAQTNVFYGALNINGAAANATVTLTNTTVFSSGNVDLGNVPFTTSTLNINSNATLRVGSWLVFGDGGDATGTVNLNGGTLNVNNGALLMGGRPGATSTLNINSGVLNKSGGTVIVGPGNWNGPGARTGTINQSGGTFTFPDEIQIGQEPQGTGIYNLSGGVVDSTGWFVIGRAGGTGIMNMTGGTLTHTSGGQPAFIVGSGAGNDSLASVGVLNHSGGTLNSLSEYWVAENTASVGTNNISGTAVVNVNNWVSLGRRGVAEINFSGGTFTKTGGGEFILAEGGGTCYWNQSGGTLTMNNQLWIGQGGGATAELNLSAGTVSVGSWVAVGRAGGTGTLNVSGGSLTKLGDNGSHITVGSGGPGTVNQTGGTITSVQSTTFIGEGGQPGVWNMSGGAAVLTTVFLPINNGANGTLNLNGGTFTATEITSGNVGGTGTLNFNGGTLVAGAGANGNFLHDLTTANVQSGGAIIDSGANVITVAQALLDGGGNGGLTKLGAGTLNLNGVNTYTGTTLVNVGTLGGNGTIAGPVSVAAGATFAPGTSIGTLTINNTLGLAGTSTTIIEVSKSAATNDLVTGVTTVTYGGTLVLKNLGGLLAVNDTFKVFDAAAYSGSFSSVVSQTPGQLVTWDVSNLAVNGTVRVATVVAAPVTLVSTPNGNTLDLSWPVDQLGWRLEVQTNALSTGLSDNWFTVPGSTEVTEISVPVVPGNPTVFYRLVFP